MSTVLLLVILTVAPGYAQHTLRTGTLFFLNSSALPAGFLRCDGSQGTPDLRGRMVVSAGGAFPHGLRGGSERVTLSIANLPSHRHLVAVSNNTGSQPDFTGRVFAAEGSSYGEAEVSNFVTGATSSTGGSQQFSPMPPFLVQSCVMAQLNHTVFPRGALLGYPNAKAIPAGWSPFSVEHFLMGSGQGTGLSPRVHGEGGGSASFSLKEGHLPSHAHAVRYQNSQGEEIDPTGRFPFFATCPSTATPFFGSSQGLSEVGESRSFGTSPEYIGRAILRCDAALGCPPVAGLIAHHAVAGDRDAAREQRVFPRDRFLRGSAVDTTSGANEVTLLPVHLPAHNHLLEGRSGSPVGGSLTGGPCSAHPTNLFNVNPAPGGVYMHEAVVQHAGGSQKVSLVPPFHALETFQYGDPLAAPAVISNGTAEQGDWILSDVTLVVASGGSFATSGTAILAGSLTVTLEKPGNYTLVTAADGLLGAFDSIDVVGLQQQLLACEQVLSTPDQQGSTLSLAVAIDASGCSSGAGLLPWQIGAIVAGCIVVVILVVGLPLLVNWRRRKARFNSQMQILDKEMKKAPK